MKDMRTLLIKTNPVQFFNAGKWYPDIFIDHYYAMYRSD